MIRNLFYNEEKSLIFIQYKKCGITLTILSIKKLKTKMNIPVSIRIKDFFSGQFRKKIILTLGVFSLPSFLIYPITSSDIEVELKIESGYSIRDIEEKVFENDNQISRLDWQNVQVPQIGLNFDMRLKKVGFAGILKTMIPIKSGILEDYDYLSSSDKIITNYSKHDIYVDKDYELQLKIYLQNNLIEDTYYLNPFIRLTYNNFKITARDGFLQYPEVNGSEWDGSEKKLYLTGEIISYEQSIFLPNFGFKNILRFNNFYTLTISGSYSPFIFVDSLDSHYLRLIQFYDVMNDGFGGDIEAELIYTPKIKDNCFSMYLRSSYNFYKANGTTSSDIIGVKSGGFTKETNGGSGTSSKNFNFSFGIIINTDWW